MIKKILISSFLLLLLLYPVRTFSKIYLGLGPEYVLPLGNSGNTNKPTVGVNLQLESRQICKFWYGFRLDYMSFKKSDNALIGENYFTNAFKLSPEIRYNFVCSDCYKYTFIPYLQGMVTLSSIGNTDALNRLGIGGALGGGIAYSFTTFESCWMLDLNALYFAPNIIYRVDGRASLQSINVGLTLSIRI